MLHQSEQLNELFVALAQAQAEMESAEMTGSNPHFRSSYARLSDMIKASRPALTKYGLAVVQSCLTNENGQDFLETRLCHKSGQWLRSYIKINPKDATIQSLGSYISYLKRYCYGSMTGVSIGLDDDDDGNANMPDNFHETPRYQASATEPISEAQRGLLINLIGSRDDIRQRVHEKYKVENISMLSRKQASEIIEALKNHKG